MKWFVLLWLWCLGGGVGYLSASGCRPVPSEPRSARIANYRMQVVFEPGQKRVEARAAVQWHNTSPDTLRALRVYLYLNAFKNNRSTFLKGSGGQAFGENLLSWPATNWGWIRVNQAREASGADLTQGMHYVQPDDGNPDDQTVLEIPLATPLLPGDTLLLDLDFSARLPKTIVRSGWSAHDFFLWVHWFPQLGVYEPNAAGEWGWNCHQFFRTTEFYADFGNYDVTITLPDHMVVGATGCLVDTRHHDNGTVSLRYQAEDVIDFGWTAYPHFVEHLDQWKDLPLRLLTPPEHNHLAPRYLLAIKQALAYLEAHVGPYPYPTLTMVDPPLHALRSGFMEYPMLITLGAFGGTPRGVRSVESLAIHEFTHQYFMAILASNEKEEAWLDEGFVTYFEDRILDHYYGPQASYVDWLGLCIGNAELSRAEYTGLDNPRRYAIATPGWEFMDFSKGVIYGKTATMLKTLEGWLGRETLDKIIRTYYQQWQFAHPRGSDFVALATEMAAATKGIDLGPFFAQALYQTGVCDYAVTALEHAAVQPTIGLFDTDADQVPAFRLEPAAAVYESRFVVERLGEMVFAQEIRVTYADGATEWIHWSGAARFAEYVRTGPHPIVSVELDPARKVYLDLNFNNNSLRAEPVVGPFWGYVGKVVFWLQNSLLTAGIWW